MRKSPKASRGQLGPAGVQRAVGQPIAVSARRQCGQRIDAGQLNYTPSGCHHDSYITDRQAMNTPAFFALIACWILWVAPFLIHKVRESKRPAQLTVTASRWGIAIQTVAYFVAWYGKPSSRPLGEIG